MGSYSDKMKTGALIDIEMSAGQEDSLIVKQKVAKMEEEGGGQSNGGAGPPN